MKKILINASNLHHGGGVQVAASFIAELAEMLERLPPGELVVYVSSAVHSALSAQGFDAGLIPGYTVFNVHGTEAFARKVTNKFLGYDLIFTIFGPLYLSRKIPNHVVGFAQLWILCPDNEISRKSSVYSRLRVALAYKIKWIFFKWSSARLIVELPHVKSKLVAYKGYPEEKIDVAYNCVAALYFDRPSWSPVKFSFSKKAEIIKIGYPARAYSHKNLEILLAVALELRRVAGDVFEFYVTLRPDEWSHFSDEYRSVIKNVGELSPAQCPSFYEAMNGVLFVSLLECFSATPLEAIAMRRAIFASDREFVRDCCGPHAVYVDPLDPEDIAAAIHRWFFLIPDESRKHHLEEAYAYLLDLPNSKSRAIKYIEVMKNQLNFGVLQ